MNTKELYAQLRLLRKEMKAKGIRRISFMNGGHSPESYRLNVECFKIESQIKLLHTERERS